MIFVLGRSADGSADFIRALLRLVRRQVYPSAEQSPIYLPQQRDKDYALAAVCAISRDGKLRHRRRRIRRPSELQLSGRSEDR